MEHTGVTESYDLSYLWGDIYSSEGAHGRIIVPASWAASGYSHAPSDEMRNRSVTIRRIWVDAIA